MTIADAEGHVLGNFHAYYSFNPVDERLRFMDVSTSNAVRQALLALSDAPAAAPKAEEEADATSANGHAADTSSSTTVIDIGCNEGDLTIGLYDALNGGGARCRGSSSAQSAPMAEDVAMFDANSTSVLNDMLQKEKKRVEFVVSDEGGTSHRKHFACEVHVDGECVGKGEGVSKKVAKAKAAEAALQVLRKRQEETAATTSDSGEKATECSVTEAKDAESPAAAADEEEPADTQEAQFLQFEKRKKLFVLGVDIDKVLIERAAAKPVTLSDGDVVQFCQADVSEPAFDSAIRSFLELAKRPLSSQQQRQFDLVTCFSVTMWIHLNKGDDGLWKFLERVSDMANHLIIEPQPWKCYRCVFTVSVFWVVGHDSC